jgi:hypothetical protein
MNVTNLASGLRGVTSHLTGGRFDVKAAARSVAAAMQSKLSTPTAAMRQVLSQYDMTNITPNDFANLVQQLTAKGAISSTDAQQLASIPGELQNAGVAANEPVNLLQFYQEQVSKIQQTAAQSPNPASVTTNFSQLMGRMQWVAKFAAARNPGGQTGLNAVV